jgi:outer membrane protein assembly factor BamA
VHFGRYGADQADPRLAPIFLGYQTLVRGYEFDSFEFNECTPTLESSCPEFDDLIGTRVFVANAELRFPLFGAFTGDLTYGPIPVEGFLFGDAGVAWTKDGEPSFAGGSRDFVRSVGGGLRVNALGFAIVELHAVKALDRNRGWRFAVALQPGF